MLVQRLRQHNCQLLSRHARVPSPPPIRPRSRAFHATAPRQNVVYDALLQVPHSMLCYIHTSMPWYAAIPVSAFILRALLVTTMGARARALTSRYIGLHPLRQAIALTEGAKLKRARNFKTNQEAKRAVTLTIREQNNRLHRDWDCRLRGQIGWTLLQIPIALSMGEIIRKMGNYQDGLFGMGMTALGLKEAPYTIHGMDMGAPNLWYEPSLANEGILWFPDLLVPDPTGVLPFVVSGLMFTNVFLSKNVSTRADMSMGARFWRNGLLLLCLAIGPLLQHVPAALLYYWASSTSSVLLWNFWLDWRYPAPRGLGQCKRPRVVLPSSSIRKRQLS
ncbi:hypothetical protein BDV95DRAFT_628255 [Massariosphaeria phaeospora]|uniref:60Kd inner membrane protein-domain-containing protein n=1 Tax=Massariosphaeria phaeospora TaxID=100035 RepID=A0A7C8I7K6_9PLEO|nr:hypothetical protein BDV95DRAFT_628255 [Massariosphaeria phaeospora]